MSDSDNKQIAALTSMTSDVNVGMDEVVSVFVSRYETQLFDKKDELGKNIKTVKGELTDLDKRLIASVNKEDYNNTISWVRTSKQSKVS